MIPKDPFIKLPRVGLVVLELFELGGLVKLFSTFAAAAQPQHETEETSHCKTLSSMEKNLHVDFPLLFSRVVR